MPRAFLSHSSKDKERYVRIVARHLGDARSLFDEVSFEDGLPTIEEIARRLHEADLFVLFVSDAALNSAWVKHELSEAHRLLKTGDLHRLFPIIIDSRITHADPRIPAWMRKEFNLKYVSRPTDAARRIEQQLRRLSWRSHPTLHARERIFVGRNDLVRSFEERVDSLTLPPVGGMVASGMRGVGRRALMRYCLAKASIVSEWYEPPVIALSEDDSIEDVIVRVFDLGFSDDIDLTGLMTTPLPEKLTLLVRLLTDASAAREILFVIDNGCMISRDGDVTGWPRDLFHQLAHFSAPVMAIASRYRLAKGNVRALKAIYVTSVPELDPSERRGLLKRYVNVRDITLTSSDLQFVGGLLTGLPEQIFYAVDLIADEGIAVAHKQSYRIVEFSSERISSVLANIGSDAPTLALLALLGQFDFAAERTILDIADESGTGAIIESLHAMSLCEYVGASGEYIRLNDAVRDYIQRKVQPTERHQARLNAYLANALKHFNPLESDAADVLITLKNALLDGIDVDVGLLMPSHFLRAIRELYDAGGRNKDVVRLADRVLVNAAFLDERIESQIRFHLCLALARLREGRFFEEVERVRGIEKPDRQFLYGFYFRHTGQLVRAIENFSEALKARPRYTKAIHELARIFIQLEAFALALPLARDAYRQAPHNTYFIRTLYEALIRSRRTASDESDLKRLLAEFRRYEILGSDMILNAEAQYAAFVEGAQGTAHSLIESAIRDGHDVDYHLFTAFQIAAHFRDAEAMGEAIKRLGQRGVTEHSPSGIRLLRMKALFAAISRDLGEALRIAAILAPRLPEDISRRLRLELEELAT